jgi:hypothetical protein
MDRDAMTYQSTPDYDGPERRSVLPLTEDQLEAIAERAVEKAVAVLRDQLVEQAAERAIDKLYSRVGKTAIEKVAMIVGLFIIAALLWAGSKGIKP